MTEIVLLYILTAMTAAGLILSILLLQKYGAAQTEIVALKAEQQRLAALGYPLDEGPIEEDNVRFLLIRGPDGERLEFDACKR